MGTLATPYRWFSYELQSSIQSSNTTIVAQGALNSYEGSNHYEVDTSTATSQSMNIANLAMAQ